MTVGRKVTLPFSEWSEAAQKQWRDAFPRTQFAVKRAPDPSKRVISDKYLDNILQSVEMFFLFQEDVESPLAGLLPAQRFNRADVTLFALDLLVPRTDLGKETGVEPQSINTFLNRLLAAAIRLDPKGKYGWLRRLARKYPSKSAEKKVAPLTSRQLYEVGLAAMRDARVELAARKKARCNDAQPAAIVLYRDGLLCAYLALMPLRIGELLSLEIGNSFILPDPPLTTISVDIPASEPKHRIGINQDVPIQLNNATNHYLNHIWPLFRASKTSNCLWLATNGTSLDYQGAYAAVTRLTQRRAKKSAPHDARRAAADTAVRAGVPRSRSAARFQHSSPQMRDTYASEIVTSEIAPITRRFGV